MELFMKKNKNISTINFFKKKSPNYFEVFYFDVYEPFILVKLYKNKELIDIKRLELKDIQIDGGVILNKENIISTISEQLKEFGTNNKGTEKYFLDLKICSTSIFKSTISLPKISFFKAFQLKQKELKNSFDKYGKYYKLIEDKYNYNLGIVYNEYFIDNNIIKNWLEISKALDIKLSSIQLFSGYLFEKVKENNFKIKDDSLQDQVKKVLKNGDFALIHIYNGIANFILSREKEITNTYAFSYSNLADIINKFILIIGKHEFEFEKKMIKNIIVDSDITIDLKSYIKNADIYYVDIDISDTIKDDSCE